MVKSVFLIVAASVALAPPLLAETPNNVFTRDNEPLTSSQKTTNKKTSLELCYNNEGSPVNSKYKKPVDAVLDFGERRDAAGTMYLPKVPEAGDDSAQNQEINHNSVDTIESFEWFANVVPFAYDEANPENINGLPPDFVESQLEHFINFQIEPANWGYKKWMAFDAWWLLFIGIDPSKAKSGDIKNTVFGKDLEERGEDNLMKKQYMSALTCDKLPLYEAKIQGYIDRLKQDILAGVPVLSSWSAHSQEFALDVHLGGRDHPQFMVDYLELFVDLQAPGTTDYVKSKYDDLQKASCLSNHVRDYVEERRKIIMENNMDDTLIFHWDTAGLPKEAIVAEIVHNLLAWGQLVHILFRIIRAQLQGYQAIQNVEVGPVQIEPLDLFEKMEATSTVGERLNVARETMRLLLPVGEWFSQFQNEDHVGKEIKVTDDQFNVQTSKHRTVFIQAMNDNFDQDTFDTDQWEYDTDRYAPEFEVTSCPFLSAQDASNPSEFFTVSAKDGETVIPVSHTEYFPVFEPGSTDDAIINGMKYCPFGLGYRRCPAELFILFIVEKLLVSLGDVQFRVEPPDADLFDPIVFGDDGFDLAIPLGKDRARDNIFASM